MKALEKERLALGLNQSQMAEKLGISRALYSLYLKGERNITIKKAFAYSQILGIKMVDILELGE